jgi:3-mercaptopyruvate sulfurtransferase SseA
MAIDTPLRRAAGSARTFAAAALLAFGLALLALLGAPARAQPVPPAATAAPPQVLVTAAWLKLQLARGAPLVLLDASPAQAHARAHIAGSQHVDYFTYGLGEPGPRREAWLQSLGLGTGRKVVIYDGGGTYFAPRLYHELYYLGYPAEDLLLLDGGLDRWLAEGGAVTAERTPAPARGDFRLTQRREEARVRLNEFIAAAGDPAHHALVDALSAAYYHGDAKFFDRGGHVPQARSWPAEDFFNADKTFKSAAEIQRMAAWLGVRPEQTVHTHCGGGGAAAVPYFALRFLAGFPRVTLYRESQLEWLRDERGLPFWTWADPSILRSAPWLDTWGGPMMRGMGLSGLSVIDVRSADAYALGHVPFSVSLPAADWLRGLSAPAALATQLGTAGVDPTHEAVLVVERGLDADAALAFALLREAGQRRISLLADSIDEWGLQGHPLTKQATEVGPRRSPTDLAVPAASYPAGPGRGVLLHDAAEPASAHPRVFVATSRQRPERGPAASYLQLPAASLLGADGWPLPAKDIARALTRAGVPRYSELVLFGERTDEAAIAYVVLALMGYSHVRLWSP